MVELIKEHYQFHSVKMYPINIGEAESSVFFFVEIGFSPRELLIGGRNATIAFIRKDFSKTNTSLAHVFYFNWFKVHYCIVCHCLNFRLICTLSRMTKCHQRTGWRRASATTLSKGSIKSFFSNPDILKFIFLNMYPFWQYLSSLQNHRYEKLIFVIQVKLFEFPGPFGLWEHEKATATTGAKDYRESFRTSSTHSLQAQHGI